MSHCFIAILNSFLGNNHHKYSDTSSVFETPLMVDAVTPYICTHCMTVTTHLSLAAGRSVPLGDVLGA